MSYQKQYFQDGQTLTADHLNHIEKEVYNLSMYGSSSTGTSSGIGIANASGDGVTDDTDALIQAMSQNNSVVDGGNKKYKYLTIIVENVENVEIRNVIFWKGQKIDLKGCKNITFTNCRWEGTNCNNQDVSTCGIRLMERTDDNGNEIWCENITFERCTFYDLWYNQKYSGNSMPHHTTGEAILPRSVHNLFVRKCRFEQIKSNAAIHWNTYKKCGYAEISDNLFYLNAWGGICLYAYQAEYPRVVGKVSGNHFIGCGLGYVPPELLEQIDPTVRGVGCAALLGGVGANKAPYKQHFICENNVFEDCVESSIEGAAWNPVIGNYCIGQGALQTEENCRLMEKKYHLDYTLPVRYNESINFIYRNMSKQADNSSIFEEYDPIVFQANVLGNTYDDRNGFISLKGEYTQPVIFTENTMVCEDKGKIYTHILWADFKKGIRFENNYGILPYFNSCTFEGDVILDDIESAYKCDFTKCNLIINRSKDRFPMANFSIFDSSQATLENDQAVIENGIATLYSYDIPETVAIPNDMIYNIRSEEGYVLGQGYKFNGSTDHKHIDTNVQLLKNNGDWTIFLEFTGNETTEIPNGKSGIMALFTVYDAKTNTNRLLTGGQWSNVSTVLKPNTDVVSLDTKIKYTLKDLKLLMRKKDNVIEIWLTRKNTIANDLSEYHTTYNIQNSDDLNGFDGNLYIGVQQNYLNTDVYSLLGNMEEFKVFQRSLSDAEVGMLMYGKVYQTSETESIDPVYDITTDSHYNNEELAVVFDGTFGIDTGIELFSNSSDFTVIARFELENYHDVGLTNFNFIPVLSSMNYAEDKKKSPGFDIGLSLQGGGSGSDLNAVPTGGFITIRNSWKYTNSSVIENSYFGYHSHDYGIIIIRRDGELSFYDFNMQKFASFSGSDATTIFSGTLHIGENMISPTLAGDNKLKGKVYECRIYNEALGTALLENMFPNIYSNEKRTKGSICCYVPNLRYENQMIRYIYLEAYIDMGDYATSEYAQKYPKAVGIKVEGIDDVIWVGTGSNGHIKTWIYNNKTIKPYGNITVKIVNTGLCPNLKAKVSAFKCVILTQELEYVDSVDTLDFDIEWQKTNLDLKVGDTLTGYIKWIPEDANTGQTLLLTTSENGIVNCVIDNDLITLTGLSIGEITLEASLPSGMKKIYTVQVIE